MANTTALAELSAACRDLTASLTPSIVQVHGRPHRPASGFVVGPGEVVTTSHSVRWEDHMRVYDADGAAREASVAGRDPLTDLVLLKVPDLEAPALSLSESTVAGGEIGLVLGRTWSGHVRTRLALLTCVAGPVRAMTGGTLDDVLGLDMTPYPGFSGSAIVRADGRVVALATAGLVRGTCLGLPAATLGRLLDALRQSGRVARGFLGVTSQPVVVPARQSGGNSDTRGVMIVGVAPESPAERAGLLVGDIIVSCERQAIEEPQDLQGRLGRDAVGRELAFGVLRGRTATDVRVVIGERPRRA